MKRPKLRVPRDEAEAREMINAIEAVDTRPESGLPWPERRLLIVIKHVIATSYPHLVDKGEHG